MKKIATLLITLFFLGAHSSLAASFWTSESTVTYYCPYGYKECTDYKATPSHKCKHAAQRDVEAWYR